MKKKYLIFIAFIAFLFLKAIPANASSINIDGDFKYWDQIPKTYVHFSYDTFNIKQMALTTDNDNLYMFIDMSPIQGRGYNHLQTSGYQIRIDNHLFYVDFKSNDGGYLNTYDIGPGQSKHFKVYIYEEYGRNDRVDKLVTTSDGVVFTKKTDADVDQIAEVKIPLSEFNIDDISSQKITVKNYNLGEQELTIMGASSSPYVLAGIGLFTALGALWFANKNKHFALKRKDI